MPPSIQPRVGFLYSNDATLHCTPPGHPENMQRVIHAQAVLQASGLLPRLKQIPISPATRAQIERVHAPAMLDRIIRVATSGGGPVDAGDTHVSRESWTAATTTAGGATTAVDAVMTGAVDSAFALVRPPGHHATYAASMGFCLINNIAVAAAHAIAEYGLSRIMIVDFDVHHGNGTQDIFYADDRVLFFSPHQYPAYPGTGSLMETGDGPGTGFTVNVPLPAGVDDAGYIRVFNEILRPVADRFKPELLLVSAGYDAHWRNSTYVAGIRERMTVSGYAALASILKDISDTHCPGRLAAVLEGGYDKDSLAYGIIATLRTWLGDTEVEDPVGPPPTEMNEPDIDRVIDDVRRVHGL